MKNLLWQNLLLIILSCLIVISMFFSKQIGPAFEYHRQAVLDGQLYRLLTAHLVHTNIYHSLLNLGGLILVWGIAFQYVSSRDWLIALCLSAVLVSAGLVLFNPEVQWYRGLSGILHGLLVVAVLKARQLPGLIRGIILFLFVVKVLMEQTQSGFWQSEQLIGAPVIVDAHLYGLVAGFLSYLLLGRVKSKKMFRSRF